MARNATSFSKGHKFGKGSNGQLRRDLTIELISQLNEIEPNDPQQRPKLHRVVRNLIRQATTAHDKVVDGKTIEGSGDLAAIKEIFDRLEGKPAQKIVGPDNGPLQVEYRTLEEVHAFLLERGIDVTRVPFPLEYLRKQALAE
jgi:hypothetical protein